MVKKIFKSYLIKISIISSLFFIISNINNLAFAANTSPTLSFSINNSTDYISIAATYLTFRWESSNVTSCTASSQPSANDLNSGQQYWSGNKPATNSKNAEQFFVGIPGDTAYTLTCTNGTNTISKTVVVNIPYKGGLSSQGNSTGCARDNNPSFKSFVMNLLIGCIISPLVMLMISLAIIIFIWGILKYMRAGDSEQIKSEGKEIMFWGIIGIFVIVSIWGIVAILSNTFGTSTGRTIPRDVTIPEIKL